jgi:hypothetical protein
VTRARLVWLLCLAAATPAAAQDTAFVATGDTRPVLRPDGTYFFNHAPDTDLVFEGQIAPRILILDSIADAADRVLEGGTHWGFSVSTTPMVKLRMFSEASNPVRTPSYMPKGNVQLVRMRNLSEDPVEKVRSQGPIETLLVDVIPFGHHSNGQTGCLFTNQTRNAADECVVTDPAAPRAVNKRDGSFSTNYIEAGVYYGRLHLTSGPNDYRTKWEWRIGGGVQANPKGYVGGSISDELAPLYGRTRVFVEANAAARAIRFCGRVEGQLQLHSINDAAADVPSVTTILEGMCLPARWGGTGLFLRFYDGQDYYNLGFAERITRVQFGFTLQRATFLSFALP